MQDKKPPMTNKFVGQGLLLSFNQISIAVANWLYWLVISKIALPSEIGQAISVYNLVLLIATFAQMGLEYPLLKRSSLPSSQVFGTALMIELIIVPGLIAALVALAFTDVYRASLSEFLWVAVILLAVSPLSFISRYTLLGISRARSVVIFDALATGAKFLSAYILLSIGLGAFAILFSFMIAIVIAAAGMVVSVRWHLPVALVWHRKHIIEVIREGLSNAPSILSRTIIITLSVILLASFGVSDSNIGIFYIALMLSIVAGSLAVSMSFTVIPASIQSKTDLSSGSLRLGLSLTAPIVAVFIVAPKYILSIIGPQYASADTILLVLSIAILPTAVAMNAIAKFNNLGLGRKIISIGIIQLTGFLTSFLILVPHYGSLGAAYSILIAYTASSIFAISFFERAQRRYIANSLLAVIIGCAVGYATIFMLEHSLPAIVSSVVATSVALLALKSTSISELKQLIRNINKPKESSRERSE